MRRVVDEILLFLYHGCMGEDGWMQRRETFLSLKIDSNNVRELQPLSLLDEFINTRHLSSDEYRGCQTFAHSKS